MLLTNFLRIYRYLILILVLNVVLGIIGLPWGLSHGLIFHPDEEQHVLIAKNFINQFDPLVVGDDQITYQWNARGFAVQVASLSYPLIKWFNFDLSALYGVGRVLSLFYSSLLVILVYQLSKSIFYSERAALLSALWFSLFDLKVTNSHFATPDMTHVFYFYFSLYLLGLLLMYLKSKDSPRHQHIPLGLVLPASLAIALCGAVRFDVIPGFFLIGIFCFSFFSKFVSQIKINHFLYLLLFVVLIIGFFSLATGFNYGIADWIHSFFILKKENLMVVESSKPLVNNPILYFFAVLAGTGFFATLTAVVSSIKLFSKGLSKVKSKPLIFLLVLGVLIQFLLLWFGTATFVRHALKFLPLMAILAGWGSCELWEKCKLRQIPLGKMLVIFMLLYTLAFTLTSQLNFIFDTRYQAFSYLEKLTRKFDSVGYSNYSIFSGLPPGDEIGESEVVVLHESLYGRYSKYFTTPFIVPRCCDQAYHCQFEECSLVQTILYQPDQYTLLKQYNTIKLFPEKELFFSLFGNYETFLGDVRIYERNKSLFK